MTQNIFKGIEDPRPFWWNVKTLLDDIEKSKKKVVAAFKLEHPDHALYYRGGLDELLQRERQMDAIAYVFDISRDKLAEWVNKKYKAVKDFEAKQKSQTLKI